MRLTFTKSVILFFFCNAFYNVVKSAKILAVFPYFGKSHFDIFEPYLEQLAVRGHDLLVISHFPRKQPIPNYRDIDLRGTLSDNRTTDRITFEALDKYNQVESHFRLARTGAEACERTLDHPDVQDLIKSDSKFDLLITETFNTDCFLAFAWKYHVPIVEFSTCIFMPWSPGRVGEPDNPSYLPIQFMASSDRMDFSERMLNTFWYSFHKLLSYYTMDARAHWIAARHFGEGLPALSEIARNTSLLFINTHFSVNRPRPNVPAVLEIGGLHIKPPQKVPKAFTAGVDINREVFGFVGRGPVGFDVPNVSPVTAYGILRGPLSTAVGSSLDHGLQARKTSLMKS